RSIASSPLLKGWISQYTPVSRTRRAISCVTCEPKSRIRTVSAKLDLSRTAYRKQVGHVGPAIRRLLDFGPAHAFAADGDPLAAHRLVEEARRVGAQHPDHESRPALAVEPVGEPEEQRPADARAVILVEQVKRVDLGVLDQLPVARRPAADEADHTGLLVLGDVDIMAPAEPPEHMAPPAGLMLRARQADQHVFRQHAGIGRPPALDMNARDRRGILDPGTPDDNP